jgi:hypothetical protein
VSIDHNLLPAKTFPIGSMAVGAQAEVAITICVVVSVPNAVHVRFDSFKAISIEEAHQMASRIRLLHELPEKAVTE